MCSEVQACAAMSGNGGFVRLHLMETEMFNTRTWSLMYFNPNPNLTLTQT
jgi:hypothetical protein